MVKLNSSIIITGGTSGIGLGAALAIAKARPDSEVVICSRTDKEHAADSINKQLGQSNVVFHKLDLSDQTDIRRFAMEWAQQNHAPIEALVLNAALQFPSVKPVYTKDGIEATFGITHAGHALLFYLLRPQLTMDCRIVITASGVHDPAQKTGIPFPRFTSTEDLAHPTGDSLAISGFQRYSTSKLCNVLWMYALHREIKEVRKSNPSLRWTVTAMDPGLVPTTGLGREFPWPIPWIAKNIAGYLLWLVRLFMGPNVHTTEESGGALARLATANDVQGVSGKYYESLKQIDSSKESYEREKQDDLWQGTIQLIAQDEAERKSFAKLA